MANSVIKYVKGAVTLFTLCLIGTATAAPNGNGEEKEEDGGVTVVAQPAEVPYYYTGPEAPSLADLQNLENWSTSQEPNHTCGEESDIPCFIMADSEAGLDSKLQAANNVGDVLNESPSRRENQ